MICGVDEAGKGPVLGPMVIAAVGSDFPETVSNLGLRDSKLLSPKRREELFPVILERCHVATRVIDAVEIDRLRTVMTMNECVARAHAEVIRKLEPKVAYVDACDVNAERYGDTVRQLLPFVCRIVAEHRADSTYELVSAASIVAKVMRDRAIGDLKQEYGEIGSGYPSDPLTIRFLARYIQEHGSAPPIARKSWMTVKEMLGENGQTSLLRFM
jgi:ribonuclease HII